VGELVRARAGDAASAAFHHAISRAFFVDGADIADIAIVARYAADAAITEAEIRAAWASRSFAHAIDASMHAASVAGVTGVPAFGWAGSHAISGMMEPQRAIAMLR
jgi:predicted DsbA family dithiol-disulfide isomerase